MDEIARGLLRTTANLVRLLRASWHCPGWGQKGSEWGRREGKMERNEEEREKKTKRMNL